ncbi:MAG: transglutaminase-like domain-containing protein [Spirochaetales bacterium]|nr:transglutaminase-like domain-containing protein [Spirochaetales bacterium]
MKQNKTIRKRPNQRKVYSKAIAILLVTIAGLFFFSCASTSSTVESETETETIKTVVKMLIKDTETDEEKLEKIFYFVRDEIKFDWVYPQDIPAEEVLRNRKGVCMQKANLLVAMAREAGFEARFHFMYVHKNALEDFLPGYAYKNWVDPFPHTFPEIYLNGKWIPMEATFDKELHDLCISKKINFGKYEDIVKNVSIEFSPEGVIGHQQYWEAENSESFYGEDLSEFTEYLHADVPWWKRAMQPNIFKKAGNIMEDLRKK